MEGDDSYFNLLSRHQLEKGEENHKTCTYSVYIAGWWHRFEPDIFKIQLQRVTATLTRSVRNREILGSNLQYDHFTDCGLLGGDTVQSGERWLPPTRLHGVTSRKTTIHNFTVVKTSNLI